MGIRELRLFEDPDLQKASRTVTDVNDHVRGLFADLEDTMKSLPGCRALAGNQIGVMRRIAVVNLSTGPRKLVNPVIVEQSGHQEIQEDCICFKDIYGILLRPEKIVLEALDDFGNPMTIHAEGDDASLLCHVLDHMDGKILVKEVMRFVDMPLDGELDYEK